MIKANIPIEETTCKVSPVRRSRRQIERQERKLLEKCVSDDFQSKSKTSAKSQKKDNLSAAVESKTVPISQIKSSLISESKSGSMSENNCASISESNTASSSEHPLAALIKANITIQEFTCNIFGSKRFGQILHQKRELVEKCASDDFETKSKNSAESQVRDRSSEATSDFDNIESKNYCSNHENFADFKKRHLKIVIKDCQPKEKVVSKSNPDNFPNDLKKTDSSLNDVNKSESQVDKNKKSLESKSSPDIVTNNLKNGDCSLNAENKSESPVYKEKHSLNSSGALLKAKVHSRKRKNSKAGNEKVEINTSNNTKIDDTNHTFAKNPKKCERKKSEVDTGCKRQKLSHSSDDASISEKCAKITIVGGHKRRKTISFSDEVFVVDKPEISEKNSTVTDFKTSHKAISSIVSPTTKLQKKKIGRRESFRRVVNEDEPPLFSQPDVMIKVKSDDITKRDENESYQDLNSKNEICNTLVEENTSIEKQFKDNVDDDKSEKLNIKDSCICDQGHSSIPKPIEFKELQAEDYHVNNLIETKSVCEDESNVNYLKIEQTIDDSKSFDLENKDFNEVVNDIQNSSKQDCNNKNLNDTNEDKHLVNTNEEEMVISERKSRRVIKKKEFFEDASNVTESKKSHKDQDIKLRDEPGTTGVKKCTSKRKCSNKIKDAKNFCEDSNSDEDVYMDSDEYEEDDPDKLWCICRKPHNSRFMIQCDKCEDWFHGSCVGVTKLIGKQLEKLKKEWWCPNCCFSDSSVSHKNIELSKDPVIESGLKKGLQTKDKDTKLEVQEGLKQSNKYLVDSKPKISTTRTKGIMPTLKESSSLKYVNLGKDNRKSPAGLVTSKMSKLANSPGHGDKINIKNSDVTSQKQSSLIFKKASGHLKVHLKKDSVTMLSKQFIQHKLLTNSKTQPTQITSLAKNSLPKSTQRKAKQSDELQSNKKFIQSKEKGVAVKKRQTCIECQKEAKISSCYCSDNCIDKHVANCLKSMGETKGTTKGGDFDSQRLVVFDRMKGSVITSGPTPKEIASWLKANPSYMIVYTPPSKKEAVSQKKECDSNTGTEKKNATDEAAKATVRLNVRKTLKNILIDRCKNADDIQLPEEDVEKIAKKIEEELHSLFKDNSFKYRAKYRSLMFNIKDPRNQGLFRKILKGNIPPDRLVCMSSEELASIELAKWREQENQHLLDLIKREQLEHQKTSSGLLLKKTHKGEVEIEDDLTSIIEQDAPKAISKEVSDELDVPPEKEEVKDTTHLHRSHLFDLNCKICTGKIVPPPADESTSKKIRVAHSISVDNHSPTDSVEKSVSRIVEGKSPVSSTGDDSLDQVPTSTVSIESPEMAMRPLAKNFPAKSVMSAWKGFIFMQDIAKFLTSAYKVSGETDKLSSEFPDTIQVCGRIIPDQVWDYLGKIKQSGNKELLVIYFQPANDEEAVAYQSFYSYLSSRKRYGVVSNCSKKIKDFYLIPLAAASPVPMVLVPFDGPGLPTPRPHLLLGVIVRHKLMPASIAKTPKQKPSVPKVEIAKPNRSSTPPRSYTPPLPTSQSSNDSSKTDSEVIYSPNADFKNITKLGSSQSDKLKNKKRLFDNIMSEVFSSSPENKSSDSNVFSSMKDEDRPYDPEQDMLSLTAKSKEIETQNECKDKHVKGSENLEQHKKILDALTRQVEETDRQVNALKQLIAVPENEDGVQSPNTSLIDINSVTQTGMSSFLDLPENLQEILNTVRSNSSEKIKKTHEKGDVDMRIKDLFGKQLNFQIDEASNPAEAKKTHSSHAYSFQAATPPPIEENDKPVPSGSADPRIKLRTSLPQETKPFSNVNNELSSCWSSENEPPPPGVDVKEISAPPLPLHVSNTLGQNSSQQINVMPTQSTPPLPTHLPLGFSKHTPPPSIQPFSSVMAPPPFPPPPLPVPMPPPPPENEDSWPALQQYSSFDQTQNQRSQDNDSLYHPAGIFNDNQFEHFYEEGSSNGSWLKEQNYTRGHWNPRGQRGKRF